MESELWALVLNGGGAGIGASSLAYALYLHFSNKLAERDKDQLKRDKARQTREQTLALASADRDKKLEIAQLKNELHEQRLNFQGEFLEKLGSKVDSLADNVSTLTADIRVLYNSKDDRKS